MNLSHISNYDNLISSRKFNLVDQALFSEFSGDSNPIHIDSIYSRRTIFGECIVHGVHGIMWALDSLFLHHNLTVKSFSSNFLKPITLNSEVSLYWNENDSTLKLVADNQIKTIITVSLCSHLHVSKEVKINIEKSLKSPITKDFTEINDESNSITISYKGNIELAEKLFPNIIDSYGLCRLIEMSIASEIVGMQLPGLHSLFVRLKIEFNNDTHEKSRLESIKIDNRFGLVNIKFYSHYLYHEIEAFFRDPPSIMPSINDIAPFIKNNEFKDVKALILGGSRGLGELTSKIIAIGGGESTITYNAGREDAEIVYKEILQNGYKANILQLDISDDLNFFGGEYNQMYYFASPKILNESKISNSDLLQKKYTYFYIESFKKIANKLQEKNSKINIFYPSTVFIDEEQSDFKIYAQTKLLGEQACSKYEKNCKVLKPRLPRMKTDQTVGLSEDLYNDPMKIMIPYIREMACG